MGCHMKTIMNYSTFSDDLERFKDARELREFYETYGCAGIELTPYGRIPGRLIWPDMIIGIHVYCLSDWMDIPRKELVERYRGNLELARDVRAEYVVFHVAQVSDEECFTYELQHTDEQVIREAGELINDLLDGQGYSFDFLMENLWWPGLNFVDPRMTSLLLELVHYDKKGFMLDTGHFLHTNRSLKTQTEAVGYLHEMLNRHKDILPYIKGIHLQQSLTGGYVEKWLKESHVLPEDPEERMSQVYEHIFQIDRHLPFTTPDVRTLVERIAPQYVTYEYITHSKEEHAGFLQAGQKALCHGRI